MTSRRYSVVGQRQWDGSIPVFETFDLSSPNSPRVNGRLLLRANPMSLRHSGTDSSYATGSYGGLTPTLTFDIATIRGRPEVATAITAADQKAYGKLRGKLYEGNASLGVTIASYKQSREMIVEKSRIISVAADNLSSLASGRRFTRNLANRYLETIFGWQPLLADIHAASMTVIQKAIPGVWFRESGLYGYSYVVHNNRPTWYSEVDAYAGTARVTYAGKVRITNPNLWLAERAGLVNPLAVAWDLVPWSFVVNMFSNVGSIVNSISDYAGLTFEDFSRTETHARTARNNAYTEEYPGRGSKGGVSWARYKERILTAPLPPRSLTMRIPEANWTNAAMAASLMVQKVQRPLQIVSSFRK